MSTPYQSCQFLFEFLSEPLRLYNIKKGERWDSNPRMVEPQTTALTTWPRSPYIFFLQ